MGLWALLFGTQEAGPQSLSSIGELDFQSLEEA